MNRKQLDRLEEYCSRLLIFCNRRSLIEGLHVHSPLLKLGIKDNLGLSNNLLSLYSRCGKIEDSRNLFDEIPKRDVFSWTTMISAYTKSQNYHLALPVFNEMVASDCCPNECTFSAVFTSCAHLRALKFGACLHSTVIKSGFQSHTDSGNSLILFYSKCGHMSEAFAVFGCMENCNTVTWTTMLTSLVQAQKYREALNLYADMTKLEVPPNEVTFGMLLGAAVNVFINMQAAGFKPIDLTYSAMLSLCSSIRSLKSGMQIHSRAIIVGLENDVTVGNPLVNMYMKCSETPENAFRVFDEIDLPDIISWTTLISGLADQGFEQECFDALEEILFRGIQPDLVTISSVLKASSQGKYEKQIMELHGFILRRKMDKELPVASPLANAYASSMMLDDAWNVVYMMEHRNIITYTGLLTRLNETGHHEMALSIICRMHADGIRIEHFSLAGFLSAAANLGTLEIGNHFHCYSIKSGLNIFLGVSNSLISFYGKCGFMEDAIRVHEELSHPDVWSWNALIFALASNLYISSALSAFDDMSLKGIKPNSTTLTAILYTCSLRKSVELGLHYFRSIKEAHDIMPKIDHYVYLVDLLGQAGRLEEAVEVIETMPCKPTSLIFKKLLRACIFHRNLALGKITAMRGVELVPHDSMFYILLAGLYDNCGEHDSAEKVRRLVNEKGMKEKDGKSWVEVHGKIHSFIDGDQMWFDECGN